MDVANVRVPVGERSRDRRDRNADDLRPRRWEHLVAEGEVPGGRHELDVGHGIGVENALQDRVGGLVHLQDHVLEKGRAGYEIEAGDVLLEGLERVPVGQERLNGRAGQ